MEPSGSIDANLNYVTYQPLPIILPRRPINIVNILLWHSDEVELGWLCSSVMDCYATAPDSIPGGNSVLTELHILRKGQ